MDTMVIEGGFADPVLDAQGVFRALLDALARPGTRQKFVASAAVEGTLWSQIASALLTLTDADTPIWLSQSLHEDPALLAFVAFHTGAPIVQEPDRAAFAFARSAAELPSLAAFNAGTQEYPDRSTTLVLEVPALEGGPVLTLRGPGIREHHHISPTGLPVDFLSQWSTNRTLFPRGIDVLLMSGGEVMGLPRTTRIQEGK